MSERLEDINVPQRLLSAIRNEVRVTTEQQLNDLWMVVHSLKDSGGSNSPPAADAGAQSAEIEQLKSSLQALQKSLDTLTATQSQLTSSQTQLSQDLQTANQEIDKKIRGVRKRMSQQMSGEMPALPAGLNEQLETVTLLKQRWDKTERELSQIGGAAALFETRLYDLENRLARRIESLETRPAGAPLMSNASADQLSDETLMSQASTVNFLVEDLLKVVLKYEGSDLFLKSNALPYTSLSGELVPIGKQVLTAEDCRRLILLALTLPKRKELLERRSVHQLACWHETVFRICAYFERDRISATIQRVATNIPSLEDLGVPRSLEIQSLEDSGLVFVVAPTNSGRHETLTALLQHINRNRKVRLFSLEEKIQYELADAEALVTQQEIGTDVPDLATGLASLKMLQPDGIMVSLAQDSNAALQLLELANGHCMVLVGIEANRAVEGLEAFTNLLPADRRPWALDLLSRQLRAVLFQSTHQRLDGQGTVLATELLLNDDETHEFLREGHFRFLEPMMERGGGGMHTLKMSLRKLSEAGMIKVQSSSASDVPPLPESRKPVSSLRRERPAGEVSRLEPPPPPDELGLPPLPSRQPGALLPPPPSDEPLPPIPKLAPPPPPAKQAPARKTPMPATEEEAPAPQGVPAGGESGDDTLMGWL